MRRFSPPVRRASSGAGPAPTVPGLRACRRRRRFHRSAHDGTARAARFFLAGALGAGVAAAEACIHDFQPRAHAIHLLPTAPVRQIRVQRPGYHHDRIAALLMPAQPLRRPRPQHRRPCFARKAFAAADIDAFVETAKAAAQQPRAQKVRSDPAQAIAQQQRREHRRAQRRPRAAWPRAGSREASRTRSGRRRNRTGPGPLGAAVRAVPGRTGGECPRRAHGPPGARERRHPRRRSGSPAASAAAPCCPSPRSGCRCAEPGGWNSSCACSAPRQLSVDSTRSTLERAHASSALSAIRLDGSSAGSAGQQVPR